MSGPKVLSWLGAGLVAAGLLVGSAEPALAHAELVSTDPEYGATVTHLDRVVVRYDRPVNVRGAKVILEHSGERRPVELPSYASVDHQSVVLPLPALTEGRCVLTWFLLGSDGHVLGGELLFTITPAAPYAEQAASAGTTLGPSAPAATLSPSAAGARPDPPHMKALVPLSRAQDLARLLGLASVAVLVGGVTFVAGLWRDGAAASRTQALLGGALAGSLLATAADLGLKGAAVSGQSALTAFFPTSLTALNGTFTGSVLMVRLALLVVAVPLVTSLLVTPSRAVRSLHWRVGTTVSGIGVLLTHGLLSHAFTRGPLAVAANAVHLGAVSIWLGGLTFLVVVVLPRRRWSELSRLVPGFSRLAFGCVAVAAVAGTALLVLLSPRWNALPDSSYGRFLLLKLALVIALLAMASRARAFVRRRLPDLTHDEVGAGLVACRQAPAGQRMRAAVGVAAVALALPEEEIPAGPPSHIEDDPPKLRPFVTAVSAELCIATSILGVTAALAGRAPPS